MNRVKKFIDIVEKSKQLNTLQTNFGTIWPLKYPIYEKVEGTKIGGNKLRSYFNRDELILIFDVPFCHQKCNYCSFYSPNNVREFGSKKYVDLLIKEMEEFLGKNEKKFYLPVLMFQGGTPTMLDDKDLSRLIDKVKQNFIIDENTYFGTETTPNLLSKTKVKNLYKAGFRRISIGVESFDEQILKNINRMQKNKMVYKAFENLREVGINEINIDLIFGLENNLSTQDFINTNLPHILKLKPTTVDLFPLLGETRYLRVSTKDLSDKIIKIAKIINSYFDRKIVITNLSLGDGRGNRDPEGKQKHFCGYDYHMALCKNVLGLGLNLFSRAFNNGEMHVFYKVGTLESYEREVNNSEEFYGVNYLTKEQNIKRFFIRNLMSGINLNLFEYIFGTNKKDLQIFLKQVHKIKKFVNIEEKYIYLKHNFSDLLPLKSKDLINDYFQLIYIFIYNSEDRNKFNNYMNSIFEETLND